MYGDYEDYDELMDDYNGQLDELTDQEMDARIIAARNEELAAYSDFIASLDMDD